MGVGQWLGARSPGRGVRGGGYHGELRSETEEHQRREQQLQQHRDTGDITMTPVMITCTTRNTRTRQSARTRGNPCTRVGIALRSRGHANFKLALESILALLREQGDDDLSGSESDENTRVFTSQLVHRGRLATAAAPTADRPQRWPDANPIREMHRACQRPSRKYDDDASVHARHPIWRLIELLNSTELFTLQ
ncbi:hypothetical protein J6590_034226 [Homalodisca vitripennis]|nr:hypothetical protein J6590_034226 [Homalodisca vitripennis]